MTTKPSTGAGPNARPECNQRNAISSLLTASHLITSAPDEAALADAFAQIMRSFDVDFYSLTAIQHGPQRSMKVISSWDKHDRGFVRTGDVYPIDDDALRTLKELTEPAIIEDYAIQRPPGDNETMRSFVELLGARAFSQYPLVEHGATAGLLSIFYNEPHPRSEEEVQVFSLLAQLTSVARLNLAARAELAKKVKQLNELYRIGEELAQLTEEDELLRTAASLVASEIHYATCWIAMVDEEAGVLREVAYAGAGADPKKPPYTFPLTDMSILAVAALHGGHPVVYDRVQELARARGWGDTARLSNINSLVYVPLRAGGDEIGLMAVASSELRASDDELSLLGAFGNQLASAVMRLRMNKERSQKVAELEAAYADQARLLSTVRELSTPVIPVHDGVLVLPIIGVIDASRSAMLLESLLNAIQKERASVVILDITGVPTVDAGAASSIVRSVRAAALLGARCVLVGVSAAVAQTMVELGVDLGELVTRGNLQAGISYAFGLLGRARAPLYSEAR